LLYHIFPRYLKKSYKIFKGKFIEHTMCVLIFYVTHFWNIFHSKKKWARYTQKCVLVFMSSLRYSCHMLMNVDFPRKLFEKFSNIEFDENSCSKSKVVPCGKSARQTDMTKPIVAFRNVANVPNKQQTSMSSVVFQKPSGRRLTP